MCESGRGIRLEVIKKSKLKKKIKNENFWIWFFYTVIFNNVTACTLIQRKFDSDGFEKT